MSTLLDILPIDIVFDLARNRNKRMTYNGRNISIRRMECFAVNGVKCVSCGLTGTELRLEQWRDGTIHLDLYAYHDPEARTLMTIDHIKPVSLGGKNHISNYQPMCEPCNTNKGSNWSDIPQDYHLTSFGT